MFHATAPAGTGFVCTLRGIQPDAQHGVTLSHGFEQGESVRMAGADFVKYDARIEEAPGSLVLEYREVR